MTRLHFQPIQGRTPDIINAILQVEEMASVGDVGNVVNVAVEEHVVNAEQSDDMTLLAICYTPQN